MDIHSQGKSGRDALRQKILARRDALSVQERQEKSRVLVRRLGGLTSFNQAHAILFFASFRSEVDTFFLMQQALEHGRQVAVPLTVTQDKELKIYGVTDLDRDLVPGYQGILEPNPERCPALEPSSLDLVIVPGSVFDLQGGRMGYGGGYYDRFLVNRAPNAVRVGICFDLQLVDRVPMAAHDQYLDYVVTEVRMAGIGRLR